MLKMTYPESVDVICGVCTAVVNAVLLYIWVMSKQVPLEL
jgi:hypothetical protein